MIIKSKVYYLKEEFDGKDLEDYGFKTYNGDSWHREINGNYRISFYNNTRFFKKKYNFGSIFKPSAGSPKVKKFINDLIEAKMVEKIPYYYGLFWDSTKFSDEKLEKIETEIMKRQQKATERFLSKKRDKK